MSTTISIIIPVYNGEIYLEETLHSLQNQTYSDFEIICVNDSSTDGSLTILNLFAKNDHRIKVFSKPNGGTAAKAIIYGLQFASGSYFMYSSQDDLFSSDLLEKNYNQICKTNADAVVPQLVYYHTEKNRIKNKDFIYNKNNVSLTGTEAFSLSLDWKIHGFVLWSIDIVRKVGFYEFGLNSDEYTTRMLFFNAKKIVFSSGIFYYRQDNPNSITKKWNIKLLDYIGTNQRLILFLENNNFHNKEISRIYKAILYDLIRIQIIFNKNKSTIPKQERLEVEQKISDVFVKYLNEFKCLEIEGIIQFAKKKVLTNNYTSFKMYCRLVQLYNFLSKGMGYGRN